MEHDEQRTYSISELADEVGVSTRTIRYYVSEGLLPPPVGSGPGSRYTDAHRQQLITINTLKEQYLPLKEIRKRLIGHNLPPTGSYSGDHAPLINEARLPEADSFRRAKLGSSSRQQSDDRLRSVHSISMPLNEPEPFLAAPAASQPAESPTWRRVSITDEAELLITENQYRRHQDRIDWLVQWARRVLEP